MQLVGILLLTLREIRAMKIAVGVFAVSTFGWLMLTFALNLDIVDGTLAAVNLFGNEMDLGASERIEDPETGEVRVERQPLSETEDALERIVIAVEMVVAGATYWLGLLLALFSTSTLIVSQLERGTVDVLLSKPMSRARLLAGRILGVWLAVLVLVVYLLGMVWLVISIKSGIWNGRFLLSIGVIVVMFMVMYSSIVFFSVSTRSASLSLIVTFGLIFASIILAFHEQLEPQINRPWRHLFMATYHVLPNFAEVTRIMAQLASTGPVTSWYPLLSSLPFGAALYLASFVWFSKRDF